MEEKDEYQLFVQGIPITLDNSGLFNTFVKAGPLDSARIIPPKDPSHTTTFGFVRYKSKVDASKAIEMFNNYKISTGYLRVRHCNTRPSPSPGGNSSAFSQAQIPYRDQVSKEGEIKSANLMDPLVNDDDWERLPPSPSMKSSTSKIEETKSGRSSLMKCPLISSSKQTSSNRTDQRNETIMSKDYESDVFEEPDKTGSLNGIISSEELEIGGKYAVNLLEVIDPEKFYVQIKKSSSVEVANLWNNLNNFYQEEISLADSDINQPFELELGDMCAALLDSDSHWYRARVVSVYELTKTCLVNLIDFGGEHELPFENIRTLDGEFRKLPPFSIQCKLFDVSPVGLVYDKKAIDALKRLIKTDGETVDLPTFMQIINKQVDSQTKHTIFEVDLMFANESVTEWLLKESLVKRIRNLDESPSRPASSALHNGTNSPAVFDEEGKAEALSAKQIKLNVNQVYEMRLFYYDEVDKHFYVGIHENTPDLEVLDELLQQEDTGGKFVYVTKLSQLSLYDTLEARFDDDMKWYRVCVRSLDQDSVTIYYLDFGNSQTIKAQSLETSRSLRIRQSMSSEAEAGLMKLPYQAIRCVYIDNQGKELPVDQFIQELFKVLESTGSESEFLITPLRYISNDYDPDRFKLTSFAYGIQFANAIKSDKIEPNVYEKVKETAPLSQPPPPPPPVVNQVQTNTRSLNNFTPESDREVAMIDKQSLISKIQIQPKLTPGTSQDIILTFQDGVRTIFGALDIANFIWLMETLPERMDTLVDAEPQPVKRVPPVKPERMYQDGDLVFMRSFDGFWYRGIVMRAVEFDTANNPSGLDTSTSEGGFVFKNDQHLYSVYLVDIGSTESEHTSDEIRSFEYVASRTSGADWDRVFSLPFLAYALHIPNKKECIANTELLYKYISSIDRFHVKIHNGEPWYALVKSMPNYPLFKYGIDLSLFDGTSIDAQLEIETAKANPSPAKSPLTGTRFFPSEPAKQTSQPSTAQSIQQLASQFIPTPSNHIEKSKSFDLNEKPFHLSEIYAATMSCFDEEMFIHLKSEESLLNKMERQLGDYQNVKNISHKFQKGDFVLAKYFEDETDQYIFNWYRAVLTNIDEATQRYQVFYLDYGNMGENLTLRDLNVLPDEYSLARHPPFAHKIEINKCQHVNLADYQNLLIDFIGSGSFFIKVMDQVKFNLKDSQDIVMFKHLVEIYDEKKQACLNVLINPDYKVSKTVSQVKSVETVKPMSSQVPAPTPTPVQSVEAVKPMSPFPPAPVKSVETVKPVSSQAPAPVKSLEAVKPVSPLPPAPVKKQPKVDLNINKLETGQNYPAAIAFMEEELFVYLEIQLELLSELETKLSEFKSLNIETRSSFAPQQGQIVLAKYYNDSSYRLGDQFNWCRALVVKKQPSTSTLSPAKYEIFYFDYGNRLSDIESTQLLELPDELDLAKFPPLAFKVSLSDCKLDFSEPGLATLLTEFLTENPEFNIKVISTTSIPLNEDTSLTQYNVEIWDKLSSLCLNSIIKELEEADLAPIETSSLADELKNPANLPFKLSTVYTYIEKQEKPFYFSNQADLALRNKIDDRLNEFFSANYPKINTYTIKIGDYVAVKSEDRWYRGQIKSVDEKKQTISVLYIDYGFEETLDTSKDMNRLSELPPEFYNVHRLAIACFIVNQKGSFFEFSAENKETFDNAIAEFIDMNPSKESNEWEVVIKSKLTPNAHSKNYELYDDEVYYGIELYLPRNLSDKSLNEILVERMGKTSGDSVPSQASNVVRKPAKPAKIRINPSDIPSQSRSIPFTTQDIYHVYLAGGIESFYVFMNRVVDKVQSQVQLVCEEMCHELKNVYDAQSIQAELELDDIKIGDYVFAKLVEDDAWYRCRVNNRNQNKYELFFIDMGNLTVIDRDEIMYPWSEKHVKTFTDHAPQAYYCRMYGLTPKGGEFSMDENDKFKKIFKQKIAFHVHFLKFNPNQKHQIESGGSGQYEVVLDEVVGENNKSIVASVHTYLLENSLAILPRFDQILKTLQTVDEIEFYKHLLDQIKQKL